MTNSSIIYKDYLTIVDTFTKSDCLVFEHFLQAYFIWIDKVINFT